MQEAAGADEFPFSGIPQTLPQTQTLTADLPVSPASISNFDLHKPKPGVDGGGAGGAGAVPDPRCRQTRS